MIILLSADQQNLFDGVLHLATGFKSDDKLRAFAHSWFNSDASSHLLNQTFADAQSQPNAKLVSSGVCLYLVEIDKEIIEFVCWYPAPEVLHLKVKVDVVVLG